LPGPNNGAITSQSVAQPVHHTSLVAVCSAFWWRHSALWCSRLWLSGALLSTSLAKWCPNAYISLMGGAHLSFRGPKLAMSCERQTRPLLQRAVTSSRNPFTQATYYSLTDPGRMEGWVHLDAQ